MADLEPMDGMLPVLPLPEYPDNHGEGVGLLLMARANGLDPDPPHKVADWHYDAFAMAVFLMCASCVQFDEAARGMLLGITAESAANILCDEDYGPWPTRWNRTRNAIWDVHNLVFHGRWVDGDRTGVDFRPLVVFGGDGDGAKKEDIVTFQLCLPHGSKPGPVVELSEIGKVGNENPALLWKTILKKTTDWEANTGLDA